MSEWYMKAGYTVFHWKGIVYKETVNTTQLLKSDQAIEINDFTLENIAAVARYAEEIHLQDLSSIFRFRMTQCGVTMKAATVNGRIVGYGTLRATSPDGTFGLYLYADSSEVASALAMSLVRTQRGKITLVVLTPEPNMERMNKVWESLGVKANGEWLRNILSTNGPAFIPVDRIYAISRFEGHPL